MGEWQPIETAPREQGRGILVFCADSRCSLTACWWDDRWEHFTEHANNTEIPRPSHWMPLPAPPAPKTEEVGDV